MTPTHRTFDEIRSLSPSEQRALFASGDPATRLHAAWAIALTIGPDTVPMLRAASIGDVPEGLRQQFIVRSKKESYYGSPTAARRRQRFRETLAGTDRPGPGSSQVDVSEWIDRTFSRKYQGP